VVLVFVETVEAPLPNDDELRRRFGLTRKEAGVARLIAEDQTNEQIAKRLSISPHTARHHTERILAKLGAKSRTLVRNALVQGAGQ
jgi:DNA-binding CsgD family transcriptional regulator